MPDPISGSCLCGKIRFAIDVPVTELRACHCTNCQKASGGAGTVNAMLPATAFRVTQGAPKKYTATADSGRVLNRFFCGDCGSPIYSQREQTPENVAVRAGTFDNAGAQSIVFHIWTKSARPWDRIDPAVKQHPGQPDALARP